MSLLTKLTSIFSSLRAVERRAEETAKAAVVFVAQAYHALDGELRHNKVVEMLRTAYPQLKGWTLQALAGAAYGYIKAKTPEKLQPALGAVADEITEEVARQGTVIHSPFATVTVGPDNRPIERGPDTVPSVFPLPPATQPPDVPVIGVGEFSPPQAGATSSLPLNPLRPLAPAG